MRAAAVVLVLALALPAEARSLQECHLTREAPGCTFTCAPFDTIALRADSPEPGVSISASCGDAVAMCFEPQKTTCRGSASVVFVPAWQRQGHCRLGSGAVGTCAIGL